MANWTDRALAAAFPGFIYLFWLMIGYLAFLIPVFGYFILCRINKTFVADYIIRFIDTLVTVFVFSFILVLLEFAFGIASRDAGVMIPMISDGGLVTIGLLIVQAYALIAGILFTVFPLFGGAFRMPVSLRIFETLRGRSASQIVE